MKISLCRDTRDKELFSAIALGESGRVNKGLMFVRMHPRKERKRSQQEIIGFLRRELNKEPGMTAFVNAMTMSFGSSRGPALEFIIKGPTSEGTRQIRRTNNRQVQKDSGRR